MNTDPELTPPPDSTRHAGYQMELQRRRDALHAELTRILGSTSTFTLEIGCGHGHFLTAYAQAHPEKLCIGIDLVGERVERANRKRDRAALGNLFFLQAEARLFLATIPDGALFSELFILFPDPWPKLRHQKHRIIQPSFLSAAAPRSTEHSRLCFRTDFRPYFEQAEKVIARHPLWLVREEPWPFESFTVFQSRSPTFDSLIARRRPSTDAIIS